MRERNLEEVVAFETRHNLLNQKLVKTHLECIEKLSRNLLHKKFVRTYCIWNGVERTTCCICNGKEDLVRICYIYNLLGGRNLCICKGKREKPGRTIAYVMGVEQMPFTLNSTKLYVYCWRMRDLTTVVLYLFSCSI